MENQSAPQKPQDDDGLKAQKDILWGLYQEHRPPARHNETMRSTVNNILIVASAGLVTLATYDRGVNKDDLPAAALLIGFGLLGFLFSVSHTEGSLRQKRRAREYWVELDNKFFASPGSRELRQVRDAADKHHKNILVRSIRRVSNSHILWMLLPLLISLIGLYMMRVAIQIPRQADGRAEPPGQVTAPARRTSS